MVGSGGPAVSSVFSYAMQSTNISTGNRLHPGRGRG